MEVLKKRFGKKKFVGLPGKENPKEQNKLWYKILKLNESKPSVSFAHQHFLLMRDIASVTPLLMVAAVVAAFIRNVPAPVWALFSLILAAELILAIGSARSLGCDLVRNVLAEESAKA
jgi:hypothetical protein